MLGKIDGARSAVPQQRKQAVLPKNEAAVFSSQEHFGLPFSQCPLTHQRGSDRLWLADINSLFSELGKKRGDAIFADEPALPQTAGKSCRVSA